jgi:hypothetical protein
MSFGVQVGSYRQLLDAISFLRSEGCQLRELPPELSTGIDHSVYFVDPDGHLVQLYFQMEQLGWSGTTKPRESRRPSSFADWPAQIEAQADTYAGQIFLGPLG